MEINFKYDESEVVYMIIDPEKRDYMITSLIRQNNGNYYTIYDGGEIELKRAEYEIERSEHKRKNSSKAGFGTKLT